MSPASRSFSKASVGNFLSRPSPVQTTVAARGAYVTSAISPKNDSSPRRARTVGGSAGFESGQPGRARRFRTSNVPFAITKNPSPGSPSRTITSPLLAGTSFAIRMIRMISSDGIPWKSGTVAYCSTSIVMRALSSALLVSDRGARGLDPQSPMVPETAPDEYRMASEASQGHASGAVSTALA